MSWLDHYEKPVKLRWKLFAIFLGIVGGLALALILEWYYERKNTVRDYSISEVKWIRWK